MASFSYRLLPLIEAIDIRVRVRLGYLRGVGGGLEGGVIFGLFRARVRVVVSVRSSPLCTRVDGILISNLLSLKSYLPFQTSCNLDKTNENNVSFMKIHRFLHEK